jgi:hypothetical protein
VKKVSIIDNNNNHNLLIFYVSCVDFPEPPPDFGGGGGGAKKVVSQPTSGMPSNFPVMSVSAEPAVPSPVASRPAKKMPAGAVNVMPTKQSAPAAKAKSAPVVEVEDEDDMDDLAARFAALKR